MTELITDGASVSGLLEQWRAFQVEKRYELGAGRYVETVKAECGTLAYRGEPEPVVPANGFDLGPATLTVNAYNALVLNSPNLLIADIDEGDPGFSVSGSGLDEAGVIASLGDLPLFDAEFETNFSAASWKVYETHSGWRLICTSHRVNRDNFFDALRLLRFLRSDPQYIELCDLQQCFRARLTPKPWRDCGDGSCVCRLIHQFGSEVAPELESQIWLHDELTLPATGRERLA